MDRKKEFFSRKISKFGNLSIWRNIDCQFLNFASQFLLKTQFFVLSFGRIFTPDLRRDNPVTSTPPMINTGETPSFRSVLNRHTKSIANTDTDYDFSFLHAKLFGEHNHLVGDPWSRNDSVYWISGSGKEMYKGENKARK